MNITPFQNYKLQNNFTNNLSFKSKENKVAHSVQPTLQDIINRDKKYQVPQPIEISEKEAKLWDMIRELRKTNLDIECQKRILREFYSHEDNMYKQELLKKRRNLVSQINKFIKKENSTDIDLKFLVETKIKFNRFIKRITDCKNSIKLDFIAEDLEHANMLTEFKEQLYDFINHKVIEFLKHKI